MKILVASDTHYNIEPLISAVKAEKPDKVFLLGDILGREEEVEATCEVPITVVRGNCDSDISLPSEVVEEIGRHKVLLTHGHYYGVGTDVYDLDELIEAAMNRGCDMVFYGHTHYPLYERNYKGMTILNPGSITSPRQPGGAHTYAILEVDSYGRFQINMREI